MTLRTLLSRRSARSRRAGFTLAEVMIVTFLVASASVLAIPSWQRTARVQRGMTCGANLRIIQAAKQSALADDPSAILNAATLQAYLPNGVVPACPSGGIYAGMFDASVAVSCSKNGDPTADPASNPNVDVTQNGQHDPYVIGGQQTLRDDSGGPIGPHKGDPGPIIIGPIQAPPVGER